jgi:hypothetical protein
MLERIRHIFSKPKSILSDESRYFITKLAPSHIWLLVVGLRGTPSMPANSGDAAFEVIATHRIDVSEVGEDDSVWPFNYPRDGKRILPFFSSKDLAMAFGADSGFRTDLLTVFQPYSFLAGFVATPENDIFELVLDPRSPAERKITRHERLLLGSLSNPV